MVSPEIIATQFVERQAALQAAAAGLSGEGMAPSIGHKRSKKKWFVLIVLAVVVVVGLRWWASSSSASSDVLEASVKVARDEVADRAVSGMGKVLGSRRVEEKKETFVDVLWVRGATAGLRVGKKEYRVSAGDQRDGVSVGMLGPDWIDVLVDGASKRLHVPLPVFKGNSWRGRSNSGMASSSGAQTDKGSRRVSTDK